MNFIAFVVLACNFAGKPCREYELVYAEMSLLTCAMVSPRLVQEFASRHPFMYAKKWRCQVSGLEKKA